MKKRTSILTIICLAILFMSGCKNDIASLNGEISKKSKLKVVTTTTMITDLAEIIGGDKIYVEGLMGSGIDPHLYKASAGDVNKMQNADIILYNGLNLEGKLGDVLHDLNRNDIKTVAISKDIEKSKLIESSEFEGNFDPHIWFDISLWMEVADTVRGTLSNLDVENAKYYEENTENYIKELKELDEYINKKVSALNRESRILITAHDAFNYFGRSYGFEVKGLQGISTASEAGTSDVKDLADFIAEKKIPAVFIESSVPKRNIEALREAVESRNFNVEVGGELFSDSLGEKGTDSGSHIGTLKHNADTIVDALLR